MTGALMAAAFIAGVLAHRYGASARWWSRWLWHKARGHHRAARRQVS